MNYIVCLKHGTKYSADYVNRLFAMVSRNLTIDFEFVCLTENADGLNKKITHLPLFLDPRLTGWWYKPYFFNPHIGLEGTLLYLDLDVVVFENIDKLFTYKPNEFCIIRDFNRHQRQTWDRMNSSVFRLNTGDHAYVYEEFIKNPHGARRFHGDQDWIYSKVKTNFNYWPDEWIQSYKWEMRGKPDMVKIHGKRNFKDVGEPVVLPETSIAVFHGDPNPADCRDPWVIERWT
jgi:hypothetical protein